MSIFASKQLLLLCAKQQAPEVSIHLYDKGRCY